MQLISSFNFYPLNFDAVGSLTADSEFPTFRRAAQIATDAILLVHGFRAGREDATGLYQRFLGSFREHLARPEFEEINQRQYVVAGLYWPSISIYEYPRACAGKNKGASKKAIVVRMASALETLKTLAPDQAQQLDQAVALLPCIEKHQEAAAKFISIITGTLDRSDLKGKGQGPQTGETSEAIGAIDNLVKLAIRSRLDKRTDILGATGVADMVRQTRAINQSIKLHLVGHGPGGRVIASCAKALTQPPLLPPDSVTLLQPALPRLAFSTDNGQGKPGVFRQVIAKQLVRGPVVAAYNDHDPIIPSVGWQESQSTECSVQSLRHAEKLTTPYIFRTGVINCLDGSGMIKDHDDFTNADVSYAFASAVASTRSAGMTLGASV